jgi:hypothetical protein
LVEHTTENRGVASSILALAILLATMVLALIAAPAVAKVTHKPTHAAPAVLDSDTAAGPDWLPFWGSAYCANDQRVQQITSGGDPHPTVTGAPQGDTGFRRLSLFDGDDSFGERCELGIDNRKGPTALYKQGRHLVTAISFRLPLGFPLGVDTWQLLLQMEQTAPASNSGGTPVIELDAYGGRWRLRQSLSRRSAGDSRELWSAPATIGLWTRFTFDVRYSASKRKGYIRLGVDLNGDSDVSDPGELSPGFHTYTLKVETPGGDHDRIRAGRTLSSHLSVGLYHDSSIACPLPVGCSVDVDNMQVLRP